jgi:hypothetical protein
VFGDGVPPETLTDLEHRHGPVLAVHRMDWPVARRRRDRRWPAVALVRPDGYVAVAGGVAAVSAVDRYLSRWVSPDRAPASARSVSAEVP